MKSFLGRLMGNEKLVILFISKFVQDRNFEDLRGARGKDAKKAEMISHTLMGRRGNLSLTELYALFTQQVNLIRGGDMAAAEAMMPELSEKYGSAISLMQEWLAQQ